MITITFSTDKIIKAVLSCDRCKAVFRPDELNFVILTDPPKIRADIQWLAAQVGWQHVGEGTKDADYCPGCAEKMVGDVPKEEMT